MNGGARLPDEGGRAPSLAELVGTFLKISLTAFGGPNAHLALMLDEVVERKRWLTRERFLELVAVTNLLPGPNSSEVVIHIGYTQRGWIGAMAAGLTFLVPTWIMVTVLSALYFEFGTLPQVATLFWGLQPVIVAIVLAAGWKIGKAGVTTPIQAVLAAAGAVLSLLSGQAVIVAMVAGGAVTWWLGRKVGDRDDRAGGVGPASERTESGGGGTRLSSWALLPPMAILGGSMGTLAGVFWTHLWIGSVLFGGGYVLVALLEPYAVGEFGWLTAGQFLDGVALTQAVPGPISTLSAFVGYAAGGVPGALLGTVGIYLPAFVSVLWVAPRMERLRRVEAVRRALKGVVAVVAGAVVGVGVSLVTAGVRDVPTGVLALVALWLLTARKIPALWIVALGAGAGVVRMVVA